MLYKIKNGKLLVYWKEPGITEVVIPDGITSIGDYAFFCCESLTSVKLPDSVTSTCN